MKDLTDFIFAFVSIICLIVVYHKLSLVSYRIDTIISIQESQQKFIDILWTKYLENN